MGTPSQVILEIAESRAMEKTSLQGTHKEQIGLSKRRRKKPQDL